MTRVFQVLLDCEYIYIYIYIYIFGTPPQYPGVVASCIKPIDIYSVF